MKSGTLDKETKTKSWLRNVIGPLLMLIFIIPLGMGPFEVVPLILLIIFIVSIACAIRTIKRNRGIAKNLWIRDLLHPGLVIIFVMLDVALLYASSSMATQFMTEAANTAQRICQEKKECPGEMERFRCYDGHCSASPGLTARISVVYSVARDRQTFRIVRDSINDHLLITGGVRDALLRQEE